MNIIQSKKLGSFSPKVMVERSPVTIVRPMIYLNEETITAVHRHADLPLLHFTCPYARHNIRERFKGTLHLLEESLGVRWLSRRVVHALENLDEINLWRNVWEELSWEWAGCRIDGGRLW